MQTLTKLKDEAKDRVAGACGGPVQQTERKGQRAVRGARKSSERALRKADKAGESVWTSIRSAFADAFAGVTGRRQAERRRKRRATVAAAGVATATGVAGAYLVKKSREGSAPPAPPDGDAPVVPQSNGAGSSVATGTTPG